MNNFLSLPMLAFLRANNMFIDYDERQEEIVYSSYQEQDLSIVKHCISGGKRLHGQVNLKGMKHDSHSCLDNKAKSITEANSMWIDALVPETKLHNWDTNSTYIHKPPYFINMKMDPPGPHGVKKAYCLLSVGDSITTEDISPVGIIQFDSPAAKFLLEHSVEPKDFYSYRCRTDNDQVMVRGTFASTHLVNKLLLNGEIGPKTVHIPSGETLSVFDAAFKYKKAGHDTVVLAGQEYGSGKASDWAAKGTMLLGVKAVIVKSFERIHRSNLVGMGIIPLCFKANEDADTLQLTGHERYTIDLPSNISEIRPGQEVTVRTDTRKSFVCTAQFKSQLELEYFNHGGVLPYVMRQLFA